MCKQFILPFALLIPCLLFQARTSNAQIPNEVEFNRTFNHRTVEAGGVRLHYVTGGEGDAVILLHGFPQTWYAWRKVMPALAKRYTVVAPDLRGLGDSSKPAAGYDKKTIAGDIYGLIQKIGLKRVFVVGHDFGGGVAYCLAALHPEHVRRVVVIEAALPGVGSYERSMDNSEGKGAWFPVFHQVPEFPEKLVAGRERLYLDWFYDNLSFSKTAITDADRQVYVRAYSAPGAMRSGFMYYRTVFDDAKDNKELAKTKLKMPVLALGGTASLGNVPRDDMRKVADDVRGESIERCGHWMLDECPEEVTTRLLAFLDEDKR